LDKVLSAMPKIANPNVLAGFDHADDAGVYRLRPDLAIVQTVDFFTPIVDDPFTFGAVAAANSLSDIYAMGGTPVSALSIVAFPANGDTDVLEAIMLGGIEKMREAGCALLGGHSVADPEIKFGYSVTGTIHPSRIMHNGGAQPGDALVFTKALGTGAIVTAEKRGVSQPHWLQAAIASMLKLNREACEAMLQFETHACTDVTGFGFIGHAREMALASNVTLEINIADIPQLPGALDAIRAGGISQGLRNNRDFASSAVEDTGGCDPALLELLYDPQTSGGLLISLPPADAATLAGRLPGAQLVGRVVSRSDAARDNKPIRLL
jgi:selenide, water dikinase